MIDVKRLLASAATALLLFGTATASAQIAAAERYRLNIEPQPIRPALEKFANQTGLQVVLRDEDIDDREIMTAGARGELSVEQGLGRLLAGTPLKFEFINERMVSVKGTDHRGVEGHSAGNVEDCSRLEIRCKSGKLQGNMALARVEEGEPVQANDGESSLNSDLTGTKEIREIIVTAQKRRERLQDVAASISAISMEEIERRGLTSMDDYMRGIPGVSRMETGAGRANPIVIRGLSISPEGDRAPVGTYFGEVPLVSSLVGGDKHGSADVALVDMQQIEVLKGPQGTLYGSGSLAGIVRNRPMQPNLQQFQGQFTAGLSSTAENGGSNYLGTAVLNLPLVEDKLAVRLVGYRFSDSGYVENVAASKGGPFIAPGQAFGATIIDQDNVGQTDRDGARVSLLWNPTDAFTASYMFVRQETEQAGVPEVHLSLDTYEQGFNQSSATAPRGLGQDSTLTIHNLEIGYDLTWGQIMSSSSHIGTETRFARDTSAVIGGLPFEEVGDNELKESTQEIRLTSTLNGPFQFLVGGFYEDSEFDDTQTARWSGDSSLFPFPDPDGVAVLPLLAEGLAHSEVQQKAFFGEVSYELLDGLKATLGARRFDYDTKTPVYSTYIPAFGLDDRGVVIDRLSSSESGNVSKAGLSYKPNPDGLLYAQWSQGFRLGFAVSRPTPFCDPDGDGRMEISLPNGQTFISGAGEVESDRTDNFELGSKFSLLGGRLQLNTSVYRIDWDKIPITVFNAEGTCGTTFNAGKARSQGVEMETNLQVAAGLELQLGLSYVDAELSEDVASLRGPTDPSLEGARLPGSPRFTANAAISYDFPVRGHEAYARADVLYVGKFYNNLQEAGIAAGGYHQINLRTGITVESVSVEVFANNVTGSDDLTWIYTTLSNDGKAFRLRPRTIGAQLVWSF